MKTAYTSKRKVSGFIDNHCIFSKEKKSEENEDPDISKIKKVQSFFRGWLCRYKLNRAYKTHGAK